MAKKLIPLTMRDIVLQADAETIREAYEARLKIDDLLVKREEAYRQIEIIELQVEELMGEEGLFVYPAPPVPIAGFSKPVSAARPKKPKPPVEIVEKEAPTPDPTEAPAQEEEVKEAAPSEESSATPVEESEEN